MKTLLHTEKERIEKTIEKCEICFVGMIDTDQIPYVVPMNFGYSDGVVYLHSAPEGRSLSILKQNPNVCVTFSTPHHLVYQHPKVACSYRSRSESVIAWGKVRFEEDTDRKTDALDIIMQKYTARKFTYSEPAIENVKIWKIELEKATCKEFGVPHYQQSSAM
ncbi:pyridoxamine 5'-phosphate oxidase family protein [Parabacteroides sp. Marseille-P3160]|uniref:pyridoxamine 5'-phosphate oxidase family protein n=1 Tax=Parabacteroides sp. Marseille-P3160 TaxID=1917887 RepID=UPI0009BBD428|nr:pyridoxamine 5'-phosphate oxidase family protein [Parabacteroides sp. Marseille-P3160]